MPVIVMDQAPGILIAAAVRGRRLRNQPTRCKSHWRKHYFKKLAGSLPAASKRQIPETPLNARQIALSTLSTTHHRRVDLAAS